MPKKEYINVQISVEELRAGLQKLIRSEHSFLISETIINHLAGTPVGLARLYQSMAGVRKTFKFKPLDEVYVDFHSLSTYKMDKDKMIASGLIVKDFVLCTVAEVSPFTDYPYKVKYTYIKPDGTKEVDDSWVKEDYLKFNVDQKIDLPT